MTLLILVVSLAAMEFAVRRQKAPANDPAQDWARQNLARIPALDSKPTDTASLLALSQALATYGTGKLPAAEPVPVPVRSNKVTPGSV